MGKNIAVFLVVLFSIAALLLFFFFYFIPSARSSVLSSLPFFGNKETIETEQEAFYGVPLSEEELEMAKRLNNTNINLLTESEDGTGRGTVIESRTLGPTLIDENGCGIYDEGKVCRGVVVSIDNKVLVLASTSVTLLTNDEDYYLDTYFLPEEEVLVYFDTLTGNVFDLPALESKQLAVADLLEMVKTGDYVYVFFNPDTKVFDEIIIQRINETE